MITPINFIQFMNCVTLEPIIVRVKNMLIYKIKLSQILFILLINFEISSLSET